VCSGLWNGRAASKFRTGIGPDKRADLVKAIQERGNPKGLGPHRTTVGQAIQDYGLERLPFMKGAKQEANRINKYLRAAGLQVLTVRAVASAAESAGDEAQPESAGRLFEVALGSVGKRVIPKGLFGHRGDLADCRSGLVGPVVTLVRETAMRASEPLERARWGDVDWENKILHLRDAKAGKRDVPLSPVAIEVLKDLKGETEPNPKERIVRISYEALKAAWQRACQRAGIEDLRLHDLRHTAATGMALRTGNMYLVKALTGHKTDSQLARYVNVKASDVVAVMHADEPALKEMLASTDEGAAPSSEPIEPAQTNVVRVDFGTRRVA